MKLEKNLIDLETAKKLKKLGFNYPTYRAYSLSGKTYCCGDLVDYNHYEDVLEWISIPSLEDILLFFSKYDFNVFYSSETEGWHTVLVALDNYVIFCKEDPDRETIICEGVKAIINYEFDNSKTK